MSAKRDAPVSRGAIFVGAVLLLAGAGAGAVGLLIPGHAREQTPPRGATTLTDLPRLDADALLHTGAETGAESGGNAAERAVVEGRLIDLNAATAAELDLLPGIGPVLAQRIVDDRAENGPFSEVDDLERVKGIGARTLEKLRPYLEVPPARPPRGE